MKRLLVTVIVTVMVGSWALADNDKATNPPDPTSIFDVKEIGRWKSADGRLGLVLSHPLLKEWGYPDDPAATQRFTLQEPAKPSENPPMLVFLHGAGGHDYAEALPIGNPGPEFVLLYPNCGPAHGVDGWWGGDSVKKDPVKYAHAYSPGENRILATIDWVARKYKVDRNRIYLCGHSMGGSGALGLGMARGDIFAAVMAGVPAGVDHAWFRLGLPDRKAFKMGGPPDPGASAAQNVAQLRKVSAYGLPDPPVVLNFSSQTDGWSSGQDQLLAAMHDGRMMTVFCWAPFGHIEAGPISKYPTVNAAALEYPWLQIRKDQAYPVFTDAGTNQKFPGTGRKEPDPNEPCPNGQINAYFRWKNVTDIPAKFQIELFLVDGKTLKKSVDVPESSTADVTMRRLQKFKIVEGAAYSWQLSRDGKQLQSGTAKADETALLTIPRVTVTSHPQTLTLEPK